MLDIMTVESMELITPTHHGIFELSGEDELVVTCNGRGVNVDAFKKTYQDLMYVVVTDWSEAPENSNELMRLIVTLESGEKLDYSFVSASAVNCFYYLNGEEQLLVEREKLLSVRSSFEAHINNEN